MSGLFAVLRRYVSGQEHCHYYFSSSSRSSKITGLELVRETAKVVTALREKAGINANARA